MAQIIQLRRDTKDNWEKYDPVLAAGEIAVQLDTYQIKIGDGQKKWSELPFVSNGFLDEPEDYLHRINVTSIVYDSNNLITEIDYETGAKALYSYNDDGLVTEIDYTKEDGETIFYKVQYEYDSDGNLIKITRSYV